MHLNLDYFDRVEYATQDNVYSGPTIACTVSIVSIESKQIIFLLMESDEKITPEDIDHIMSETRYSKETAIEELEKNNIDLARTILSVMARTDYIKQPYFDKEDIKLVMLQTGRDEETVKEALEKYDGDLAKATLSLTTINSDQ